MGVLTFIFIRLNIMNMKQMMCIDICEDPFKRKSFKNMVIIVAFILIAFGLCSLILQILFNTGATHQETFIKYVNTLQKSCIGSRQIHRQFYCRSYL